MRRRLFTLAAAVSLVLCVAVVLEWVRGYWVCDYFLVYSYPASAGLVWRNAAEVQIQGGTLTFRCTSDGSPASVSRAAGTSWQWLTGPYPDRSGSNRFTWPTAGVSAARLRTWSYRNCVLVVSPLKTSGAYSNWWVIGRGPVWPLAVGLAILPTARLIARRINRPRAGCCRRCGYDLTGNTSGVCPECGTPVAGKAGA